MSLETLLDNQSIVHCSDSFKDQAHSDVKQYNFEAKHDRLSFWEDRATICHGLKNGRRF